jgi:hypothetical protein
VLHLLAEEPGARVEGTDRSCTEKKNFILKIETSGSREVMLYKQALQESGRWAPKPFSLDAWIKPGE